jgi:ATP-binding cassette, subfamily B, bacterial
MADANQARSRTGRASAEQNWPPAPTASPYAARRMIGFAWAADRRLATLAFVLVAVQALAGSLLGLWLKLFVDSVAIRGSGRAGAGVLAAGLAIAVSITVLAASEFADSQVRVALLDRTKHQLDRRLLELVGGTPTLAIQETPRHLRQLELLQAESWEFGAAVPAVLNSATTGVRVLVTLVLLASVSPLLLVLPVLGLPIVILSRHTAGLYSTGNELAAEPSRRAEMLYYLAASRPAAKEIRLLRLPTELQRRFAAEHEQIRRIHVRLTARGIVVRLAGRLLFLAGYLGAIALVVHLAIDGRVPVGNVAMTAVVASQTLALVTGSAEQAQTLLRTLTAAARYIYLEEVAQGNAAVPAAPAMTGGTAGGSGGSSPRVVLTAAPRPAAGPPVPARLTDGIRLEGISYTYPGLATPTLRGVTAALPAGTTVALVGDNGAGKTTLVKLLAGLCRPDSGQILVDGTDLARLDLAEWRLRLSAGFQDHARFEFSLQRALGLGHLPDLDDPDAARIALERAGAPDLPDALPAGLATQLGPGWPDGTDLSGGQWQKLAIGRAMMRPDPLLLLLDEPTAAIDAQSEHELFTRWTRAARQLRERSGAITVLVSHRFSTVRMADLILVLQDGSVCERGSHDELMAAGGLYAELFELQARAYR